MPKLFDIESKQSYHFYQMIKKKIIKNDKVFLLLKNNKANWVPSYTQTTKMQNDINEKIRKLENKYFQIKNLFEKLKLKRDFIFKVGKQLAEEYKDIKIGINLQSQQRRMKDSLYIWYSENFFSEIFDPNSSFLSKYLIQNENMNNQNMKIYSSDNYTKKDVNEKDISIIINKTLENSFLSNVSYNKEIDNFENSNITNEKNDDTTNHSNNFDFGNLFL